MITLQFEPQDLDYVLKVLAQRPWAEVNPLVVKLQQQLQQQPGPMAGNGLDNEAKEIRQ